MTFLMVLFLTLSLGEPECARSIPPRAPMWPFCWVFMYMWLSFIFFLKKRLAANAGTAVISMCNPYWLDIVHSPICGFQTASP